MDGEIERRRQPFVPDPERVVYPVDHVVAKRAALAKFHAETPVEVGAQLSKRIVRRAGELEDMIRLRAQDGAHYAVMEMVMQTYVGKAIEIRDRYMEES
jgi:hypothetical protein